jgi:hypothetical protein
LADAPVVDAAATTAAAANPIIVVRITVLTPLSGIVENSL